jgi:DNA repair exonuclease SbcCD ATPase subunit
MRLTHLSLSGFRGFPTEQSFDLDADAVVVLGVNGQGKTSLFDGVLWGLTGNIPRLGEDARLVSMYSPSGGARVEVELRSSSGSPLTVTRSFDGERQQLRLEHAGEASRDDAARVRLMEILWPEGTFTPDGLAALTSALTRSVYLQQDLVREFIEADSEQQRFEAVSELVGAGRVTDLSLALERAKTAWSRATNTRAKDLDGAERQLNTLEVQLATLTPQAKSDTDISSTWEAWWDRTHELTGSSLTSPQAGSSEAPRALDNAVKLIDAERRRLERRAELLEEMLQDLKTATAQEGSAVETGELQQAVAKAAAEVDSARQALEQAQAETAVQRRRQVELGEAQGELRTLAQLALRHLGTTCPVCGQDYDEADTRHRLETLAAAGAETSPRPGSDSQTSQVPALAATLEGRERAHSSAMTALRNAETSDRDRRRQRDERGRRISELDLRPADSPDLVTRVRQAAKDTLKLLAEVDRHRTTGEQMALAITRVGEAARRRELEQQVERLGADTAKLKELVDSREQTGALAGAVLDGLRSAASEVVAAELEKLDPLLQRIYATADPHPSFRVVRLLTKIARGRGRLNAAVFDPQADLSSESPETVLSSSQMNALAVSLFLALNFGVPTLPMQAVMLDDPLQSLDDVNLLGLIDLLRRSKDQRQLLVSTHDLRFGRLLARKLRPVSDLQRTRLIELSAWGPDGPVVEQYDGPRDPERLRIAA